MLCLLRFCDPHKKHCCQCGGTKDPRASRPWLEQLESRKLRSLLLADKMWED